MSIAAAFAADKQTPFQPGPASSFASHQTNDQITLGVDAYASGEKIKAAFGKLDPYQHGVLPVLVVMQNDSGKSIKLDHIRAEYVAPNRERVYATPARDVRYLQPAERPTMVPVPGPRPIILKKKNPLDVWEIEGRAFAAQMLPSGQTASGFFYFQTALEPGATIYITGLTEALTGKELLFFELPLK